MAADLVIHRAMAKRPEDRYTNGAEMARELRASVSDATATATARQTPQLIGLSLRMLRQDLDADFLGDVLKVMLHVTE